MKTPTLPKVWVVFNADGVPIAVEFLGSNAKRMALASDTIREYAPVQPLRRCVWRVAQMHLRGMDTSCGNWLIPPRDNPRFRVCPYCGGKIKDAEKAKGGA